MANNREYDSLDKFYPYYLEQHQNATCRLLHFSGTLLLFILIGLSVFLANYSLLWFLPLVGYGFAWAGHFFFEKNKPATFQYPLYSLASDFIMFWHLLTGKERFKN